MRVWNFILSNLKSKLAVTLLFVVESTGSSPGRKGFLMAVNENGVFEGTIGGGIMEVKMIELAKSKMAKEDVSPLVKKQFHNKTHRRNQSGLICSGNQAIAIMPLGKKDIECIQAIINRKENLFLNFSQVGLLVDNSGKENILIKTEKDFACEIELALPKSIHIFGAGHVGLALAKQMSILGYKIIQYDNRPEVFTSDKNGFASEIKIIDFEKLPDVMDSHPSEVVVIVSFSYRSDKLILKKLFKNKFAFIGMMGSDHKIASLRKELEVEGILAKEIGHVFMPIGLNMFSKTAEEIAVSIAGQIIFETNKKMPSGRNYKT